GLTARPRQRNACMIRLATSALALAAGCWSAAAAADTLIDNIQGVTIDEDGEIDNFTGLVIGDDGRIKDVLDRRDKRPRDVDFQVDGDGRFVIPGMIDSHVHVMGLGFAALTLDLSDTTSLEEAQAKIAEYAAANPGRRWIVGRGWNQAKWGLGRFPTAAELDAGVADRPVWLERVDGHAGWANSEAMRLAGVSAATADPNGGRIERIAGTREPSGVFVDAATALVAAKLPEPRPADRDLALQK